MGSVEAARLAIDDFGGRVLGRPVQVLYADNLNKADKAASRPLRRGRLGFRYRIIRVMAVAADYIGLAIEPAGATGLAAILLDAAAFAGQRIATILADDNVSPAAFEPLGAAVKLLKLSF